MLPTGAILREGFRLGKLKPTKRAFSFNAALQAEASKPNSLGELFYFFVLHISLKSSPFETPNPSRTEPGPKALPNCSPRPNSVPLASWRNSWTGDSFSLALLPNPDKRQKIRSALSVYPQKALLGTPAQMKPQYSLSDVFRLSRGSPKPGKEPHFYF